MKKSLKKLWVSVMLWWILLFVAQAKTPWGADIAVQHYLAPEANATVQSFNSRSAGGFVVNLRRVLIEGFKKIMAVFYSGYGHKSIADCGSTTAALDGISMLTTKAVQDHELYNGQETSTRYVDLTRLGFVNPLQNDAGKQILIKWFTFYEVSIGPTIEHLKETHPLKNGQDPKKWAVALEKRAYDILGCFIPAGARTNASCHMTLRQWDDKLSYLVHHPLDETKQTALTTLNLLQKKYPSTFKKKKVYEKSEQHREEYMHNFYYIEQVGDYVEHIKESFNGFNFMTNFQYDHIIAGYKEHLEKRPEKTEVEKALNEAAGYRMEFLIDFRSYRDLQRQRSATQRMPLLTMGLGFENWYLEQLPPTIKQQALVLLEQQKAAIIALTDDERIRQYYIPMGYKIYTTFTVGLADMIYIIELRTPQTVHPTARTIALKAYKKLKQTLPEYFKIYADESLDELSIKRADHDLFIGNKRISEM